VTNTGTVAWAKGLNLSSLIGNLASKQVSAMTIAFEFFKVSYIFSILPANELLLFTYLLGFCLSISGLEKEGSAPSKFWRFCEKLCCNAARGRGTVLNARTKCAKSRRGGGQSVAWFYFRVTSVMDLNLLRLTFREFVARLRHTGAAMK
jgi:hypothetical protein